MKLHSSRGVGVLFAGPTSATIARIQALAPTVKGIGWVSFVPSLDGLEETLRAATPDVLVLNVRPPSVDVHRRVYSLRQGLELPPLVLLSPGPPERFALLSLSVGAAHCLSERQSPRSILNTVVSVGHGGSAGCYGSSNNHGLCAAVVGALRALPPPDDATMPPDPLSRRQREVLGLVAKGCANKEIGATLYVQEQTVKNHVSAIMDKANAKDRATAAATALRNGWIPLQ